MANYKNGLETKESLYQSAKKIFYQKGYDKTTVKVIITDAVSYTHLDVYKRQIMYTSGEK